MIFLAIGHSCLKEISFLIYKMKLYIIICFSFFLLCNIYAQEYNSESEDQKFCYWISLGIGRSYFGPTLESSVSFAYKKNIFTIRYLKADEFRFNPGGADYDEPPLSFKEISMLFGRDYREKFVVLSLSAGIGYLRGIDRGRLIEYNNYEKINIASLGFSFEIKFRIEITDNIGIGGGWFGNLNSKKILSGGILELSLGKFL